MMKKLITILIVLTTFIIAQDITNKLGGNTAAETYDVTDSGDNVLFRVQGDGNVGIGTDAPSTKLHIYDDTDDAHIILQDANSGTGGKDGAWLGFAPGGDLLIRNNENTDLKFGTNNQTQMTIDNDGNVGIGTTNPDATLDVHGTVKVFGDWDNTTYITETAYQAATDGFVCAFIMNTGVVPFGQISGKTDVNNPPITHRAFNTLTFVDGSGDRDYMYIMMPVKKGDYWLVTDNFSGGNTFASIVNWIPLGQ